MHIGNLSSGAAQIHDALDKLEMAWAEASTHWKDSNSRNIEEKFLAPLLPEVRQAISAMGNMSQSIQSASRALNDNQ
ncbi:hypothetical protein MNBD_PLANCTO02-3438 [hydrothermal vent metagenome]|uniref:Uncharacterized protein n=1 Tax=hydrothermal vent metagenome TaxID=652676 RepID=A0A3B1DMS7_9ZZZZ